MNTLENPELKINVAIPGENTQKFVDMDTRYLATSTKTFPVAARKGKGMWVQDMDGNTILDFTNGMVGGTGHCHPKVVEAIREQAGLFLHAQANIVVHKPMLQLVEELRKIVLPSIDSFFFLLLFFIT